MPAIITHHLFGEDVSLKLPADISLVGEGLLAFLLGNQGPDPFYFCFTATPASMQACYRFAETMHTDQVVEALCAARNAVDHLPAEDREVGRAFVLGLLAHYLLDSEAHAFIYGQEEEICRMGEGLESSRAQVHALIESEIDTWMLWSTRQQTIDDSPAWADLARTDRIGRIAGSIFSQVAWQVFGISLGPDRYEQCLRDYELVYKAIDPTGNARGRVLASTARIGSRRALLDALSHSDKPTEECPAANLACHPWLDPLTGEENTTSFPDIFYDSQEKWPALAGAFLQGDDEALRAQMRRDYRGNPLGRA